MNYESMIDDLNMDYRFFLQECSIEAIPYNVLNEGAIIDTIKKVFGAIIDFIKGIINAVVNIFKGDTKKQIEDTKEDIRKMQTIKLDKNLKQPVKYYILAGPAAGNAFISGLELDSAKKILEEDILPNYKEYIRNGTHKPKLPDDSAVMTSNKSVIDKGKDVDYYLEERIITKATDDTIDELNKSLDKSNKYISELSKENDEFKNYNKKYEEIIKSIENEFIKEKDNPETSKRLNHILKILNNENSIIKSSLNELKVRCTAVEKSLNSVTRAVKISRSAA